MLEALLVLGYEGGDDTRVGQSCTQPLHFRGSETVYIHLSGRARRQVEIMRVQDIY